MTKRILGCVLLALLLSASVHAQTYSVFKPGGDLTGSWNSQTVANIDGTSVPVNSAADQTLLTTASATGAWKSLPTCPDTGGNHINYDTSAHAWSCGTSVPGSGGGSGSVTSVALSIPGIFTISGSPVTASGTLTATPSGTSGGIPYFSSSTGLASSAALTANALVLGGGAGGTPTVVGSLGTTTTLLHGNASGAPTFSAVSLTADVTNTLPVGSGGTGITSGTSGGVPYFSSTSAIASSGALTQYALVTGGGAGAAPAVVSGLGTTTQVLHGNASGLPSFGAITTSDLPSNSDLRQFGTTFGDTGGSALTSGSVVTYAVAYSCTISAWNISVDAGTVTFDIWKVARGSANPTVSNTITASALPALSSNTAARGTTLTGWTTSVTAGDIFGFQLKTVATAKYAEIDLECGQ